jgi:hypothetical protein
MTKQDSLLKVGGIGHRFLQLRSIYGKNLYEVSDQTKPHVAESGQHTSLLRCRSDCSEKRFIVLHLGGLFHDAVHQQ